MKHRTPRRHALGAALRRRTLVRWASAGMAFLSGLRAAQAQPTPGAIDKPDPRWYRAALAMRQRALSWGDQAYGAVLVLPGGIVGEGPSRVVQRNDPTAHAEREAIADAQRQLGRMRLDGGVLYSTSRPCAGCERAAAQAGVARMFFGATLADAGAPRP